MSGVIARVTGTNPVTPIGVVGSASTGTGLTISSSPISTTIGSNSLVMTSSITVDMTPIYYVAPPSGWTQAFDLVWVVSKSPLLPFLSRVVDRAALRPKPLSRCTSWDTIQFEILSAPLILAGATSLTTTSVVGSANANTYPSQINVSANAYSLGNIWINTASLAQANTNATVGILGNLYVNTASLAQANVNATANVFGNLYVNTASLGQANANANVFSLGNLYVNTGSLAQANANANVFSLGNLYVNTGSLSQANVNAKAYALGNLYVNASLVQVNANANVYALGNLYVNTGSLAQANVNATANSLANFYVNVTPSQANVNATANVLFGNIQITVPITNGTAVVHAVGNLYVNVAVSITNATPSATSLTTTTGLTFSATQVNVAATVNPLGNLYVNVAVPTVVATTGFGSVFGNVQVTSPITNATGSVVTLYAYGLSEANCSVVARGGNVQIIPSITNATASASSLSLLSNVQVTSPRTNANASAVSLTTTTAHIVSIAQINVAANVNPFGNLYVNTGALSHVYATTAVSLVTGNVQVNAIKVSAITTVSAPNTTYSCNVYIFNSYGNNNNFILMENGIDVLELEDGSGGFLLESSVAAATTIINASSFGPISTTFSGNVVLIHAITSATTNPLGLGINTPALAQAHVTTSVSTANVSVGGVPLQANTTTIASPLRAYGLSSANCFVTAASIFGNVQVALPAATILTTSVRSIYGMGLSEANCSATVTSIFGNVQITLPRTMPPRQQFP